MRAQDDCLLTVLVLVNREKETYRVVMGADDSKSQEGSKEGKQHWMQWVTIYIVRENFRLGAMQRIDSKIL
jgi:hypothetical protein